MIPQEVRLSDLCKRLKTLASRAESRAAEKSSDWLCGFGEGLAVAYKVAAESLEEIVREEVAS